MSQSKLFTKYMVIGTGVFAAASALFYYLHYDHSGIKITPQEQLEDVMILAHRYDSKLRFIQALFIQVSINEAKNKKDSGEYQGTPDHEFFPLVMKEIVESPQMKILGEYRDLLVSKRYGDSAGKLIEKSMADPPQIKRPVAEFGQIHEYNQKLMQLALTGQIHITAKPENIPSFMMDFEMLKEQMVIEELSVFQRQLAKRREELKEGQSDPEKLAKMERYVVVSEYYNNQIFLEKMVDQESLDCSVTEYFVASVMKAAASEPSFMAFYKYLSDHGEETEKALADLTNVGECDLYLEKVELELKDVQTVVRAVSADSKE